MNITLRAGDRLYLNGAVIQVDRRVSIALVNRAKFLLGSQVLPSVEATTPLRRVYFAAQAMLIAPDSTQATSPLARDLIREAIEAFDDPLLLSGLKRVDEMAERGRFHDALKGLRALFEREREILAARVGTAASNAR